MALLLTVALVIAVLAIVGGVWLSPWVWLVLILALVVAVFGGRSAWS